MNSMRPKSTTLPVSQWMLIALIFSIPLMKPGVAYPIVLADLVFVCLAMVILVDVVGGRLAIPREKAFLVLSAYLAAMALSLPVSPDWHASAFKLATTAYLLFLAAATVIVVRDEETLRRVVMAWLAVTAGISILAVAALIAFPIAPDGAIYTYSRSHLGSLPLGHYPRLSLTFFNANMACNYLTVSLGLLVIACQRQWLGPRVSFLLFCGLSVAALSTLSPGLGGLALGVGVFGFLLWRSRALLSAGIVGAILALIAASFTLGPRFEPSIRFTIWASAAKRFLARPIFGHGIGIDTVSLDFNTPERAFQHINDAHNVFLNIGVQAGLIGIAGLALVIGYALRLSRANPVALVLGLTFLNGFVYQGLTGAFEDTRHLWVLLGLLIAAARLPLTPTDGNNRGAGAPLPC